MKRAFTLAEVLISLTIIGVIAAITVPALIQRTNKQEYAAALQKAYSTLSQAAQAIIAEEGSPKSSADTLNDGWAYSSENMYRLFKKHLNVLKDCGTAAGCFSQLKTEGMGYKSLRAGNIKNNWDKNPKYEKLILNDGMQIMMFTVSEVCSDNSYGSYNQCGRVWVDLNGEKAPNTYGRDVFTFALKEDGLHPIGCDDTSQCSISTSGNECTCKVLTEGRMDY